MSASPESLGFTPYELDNDLEGFKRSIASKLAYTVGKDSSNATRQDWYAAMCLALRDRLFMRWHDTQQRIREKDARKVFYLSLEFLMGRSMTNAAVNLDLDDSLRAMLMQVGDTLEHVAWMETDAGLGNGGLGRLAACFLDSMATLDLAGFGYGIPLRLRPFPSGDRSQRRTDREAEYLVALSQPLGDQARGHPLPG